jgi:hypothetical protein
MSMRLVSLLCALGIGIGVARAEDRPWAAGVSDDEQARALEIFKVGNASFTEGRHAEALARYREAITHWDHPAIRYNMAVALVHLDQPLAAYAELERGLRYGAEPLGEELHAEGLTYRKLLRGQLAELRVVCKEQGAEVMLDGQRLFVGPGEATRTVLPGAHQLGAIKRGFLTESRAVTVLPGKQTVEEVKLVPLGSATRLERRWARWKPWAVVGAGAALAVLAVPLKIKAESDMDDYDAEIQRTCPSGCPTSSLPGPVRDLHDQAVLEDRLALGGFVVGGAAAIAGVVLVVLNQPRAVEIAPRPGPNGATLSATFRF